MEGAKCGVFRGVAMWVRGVLGRGNNFVFRDIGRRPVMTKLVNSPDLSVDDAAKYMHVHPRTLSVYHRMGAEKRCLAAEILANKKARQVL